MEKASFLNQFHLAGSSVRPSFDYLLLWALSGCLRLGGVWLCVKWIAALVAIAVVSSPLLLVGYLLLASLYPRRLTSVSDTSVSVVGKPLLFPLTLTHNRLCPIWNRFSHSVLMVGVPVGLKCRIGKLLSIDAEKTLPSWFTFDSKRYLHRGDEHLGLREKLDVFLRDQNEDPSQWPYAYLLSVPRFLWWERSVVTWWFLYSKNKELDAVIMEINNSFDEKRNVLFKVRGTDADTKALDSLDIDALKSQYLDMRRTVESLTTSPKSVYYKGIWKKHIYSSPFEKLGGWVGERFMDPTTPAAWHKMRSLSNTTTLSTTTGQPRMMTRLSCRSPPIDPMQASWWTVAKLLYSWTLPVTLTTPRILYQALRIEFMGWMHMLDKPHIQSGSESRRATKGECGLEPFFRQYLAHCVSLCSPPMELRYLPSKAISREEIVMCSPACSHESSVRLLTIEILDPGFYSRVIQYKDPIEGLNIESKAAGLEADEQAAPLNVSDISLLKELVQSSPSYQTLGPENKTLLSRSSKAESAFMDRFVKSYMSSPSQWDYRSLKLRLFGERISFGEPALLQLYQYAGGIAWRIGVTELLIQFVGGPYEAVYLSVFHAGVACLF
ncbi:hypothetical protein N8T08_009761 [Aspergillus melleus]|uniref:Uncharacterized protein n=1 Tax=Aspergillus melleus TaxID=138277 RepID=A0ACC3AT28_9EURO|nr:hypothetical protein N8T08_009761 [Aspergillus melleus]